MKKIVFLMEQRDRHINEYSSAVIWWYGILESLGYEVDYYEYKNFNFDLFYSQIKSNIPDYILHPTYENIHTEFLKLRELSKVYVLHSDDDWRFESYAKYWIPVVDGTISFCGSDAYMNKLYSQFGCNDSQFIKAYWCFNPNTMLHTGEPVHKHDVSFVGSVYGERHEKLLNIKNGLKNIDLDLSVASGITYEKFKRTLYNSLASVCLTTSSDLSLRQLKGRLFEIPYFTTLLTEPFPDMERYYDLDNELILFSSIDELLEKIKKHKQDNTLDLIYKNGKKRLLNEHTCYHVWNKYILPKIDSEYTEKNINKLLEGHGIVC